MQKSDSTPTLLKVPDALRNKVIDLSGTRKKCKAPKATIADIYLEAIEKGLQELEKEISV